MKKELKKIIAEDKNSIRAYVANEMLDGLDKYDGKTEKERLQGREFEAKWRLKKLVCLARI